MKIRNDFVTNSSSSSFIISTNQEIPNEYKSICKVINSDNVFESFKEKYQWDTICYDDEALQEVANLTNKQILLIKIAMNGDLATYKKLIEKTQKPEENIYSIFVDRDWLYYQNDLQEIIDNSLIIDHETDL